MFDDMIVDMDTNKKLSPTLTELFFLGRKINISIAFISQSFFKMSKSVTNLNDKQSKETCWVSLFIDGNTAVYYFCIFFFSSCSCGYCEFCNRNKNLCYNCWNEKV